MADTIFGLIGDVAVAVSGWFTSVLTASGMVNIFLGIASMVLAVRLLMSPILGRGSDKATKKKDDGGDDE